MEYGKFSSAEELLKSYNELEKSFTQKCQQLAASEKEKAQMSAKLSEFTSSSATAQVESDQENAVKTANDGTNAEASPSTDIAQSTTVDNAVTVPQNSNDAKAVLDGNVQNSTQPTEAQLQQYLENNPEIVSKLLQKVSVGVAPNVMHGGGNVSLALPSRPKSIKEASLMAKDLFVFR